MKPVKFEQCNRVIAKNQDEYLTLHALVLDVPEGNVITKWKLTFWEKLTILWTGTIWMNLLCFHNPTTPSMLSTKRKDMFSLPTDKERKNA